MLSLFLLCCLVFADFSFGACACGSKVASQHTRGWEDDSVPARGHILGCSQTYGLGVLQQPAVIWCCIGTFRIV